MATVSVVPTILDYLCDDVIRTELLPRARSVYSTNGGDVKIVLSLLACIAKVKYGSIGKAFFQYRNDLQKVAFMATSKGPI